MKELQPGETRECFYGTWYRTSAPGAAIYSEACRLNDYGKKMLSVGKARIPPYREEKPKPRKAGLFRRIKLAIACLFLHVDDPGFPHD